MLGLSDFWITSAYLLCFISTIFCMVYGLLNWNKGGDDEAGQIKEESKWEVEEHKVEEVL